MRLCVIAATLMAMAGAAWAQQPGWYVGGEAGWSSLVDEGEKAVIPVIGPRDDTATWAGGYDLGMRAGYGWGNWRVEEEFRFERNGADTFNGAVASGRASGYAVMSDLLYDLPAVGPVTPHVGAGIGAVTVSESIATAGFSSGVVHGTGTEFGYQAIGGLGYPLSPNLAVDLDYRYLATTNLHFRTPPGFVDSGHPAGDLPVTSGYNTHSIIASLVYRFAAP
jgi:opacity protein-like surface antigen